MCETDQALTIALEVLLRLGRKVDEPSEPVKGQVRGIFLVNDGRSQVSVSVLVIVMS